MKLFKRTLLRGWGTDLESGYGDVQPWRPPFHASPVVCKGPEKELQRQLTRPPFEKNLEIVASIVSVFAHILALKPPNLKISVHKTPLSEAKISSQAPHFGNQGCTSPTCKKVECSPRDLTVIILLTSTHASMGCSR